MNQQTIQENKALDKARLIAAARQVRRSSVNRNIWLVGSQTSAKKLYCVQWIEELGGLTCDCPAFQSSTNNKCKHCYSVAVYEGGLV